MAEPRINEGRKLTSLLLGTFGVYLTLLVALAVNMKGVESRTYWVHMLGAYLLGAWIYMWEFRNTPSPEKPGLWRFLFPRDVWLHPSSLNDCLLSIINAYLLGVLLVKTGFDLDALLRAFIMKTAHSLTTWPEHHDASPGVVVVYAIAAFLFTDFFYYVAHRLAHTVPWLWEFHKVHHSAKVLTPITILRSHPVDFWWIQTCGTLGMGVSTMTFLYFYHDIKAVQAVGWITALTFGFNFLGANLRHSHIWISYGPVVERFFISPAQHQIHHSEAPRHFNKNYGLQFALWDWALGSLYVPRGREELTFGLGGAKAEKPYQTLWGLYVNPLKRAFRRKKKG